MLDISPIQPHYASELKHFGLVGKIRKNPLKFFMHLANTCGSYAWLSLAGSPVLFLNDATAVEYAFIKGAKYFHKGKYNDCLRPVFGDGIFLAEEASWWKQRKEMAPVFSGKNFPEFVEQIVGSVEIMLKRWEPAIEKGESIDLAQELSWLTFDVIMRALYHQDSGDNAFKIRDYLGEFLKMAEGRIWSFFNVPMKWALRMPKQAKTMQYLDALTYELIERRRQNQEYSEDLLSRLLACTGKSPADQQLLRDNILSFMLAGQETTGNSITWSMYELGRNTDKRKKMVEEIDCILGSSRPDFNSASKLTYCAKIFSEILRMYAPAWTSSRATLEDNEIPLEDGRRLAVPKGTTVMLCAYTMHYNQRYWKDPESFLPERFDKAEIVERPKFAYFPFGGGPRLCLGFRLAEFEGILALAMIYQKYEVELLPGQFVQPTPVITLRPSSPIHVRLVPRKNTKEITTAPSTVSVNETTGKCPFTGSTP